MRIAVDLTSLSGNLSGLERYAANITQSMIRLGRESKRYRRIKWILVVRNTVPEFVKELHEEMKGDIRVAMVKGGKLFINQLKLPAVMWGIKADVYLFPAFPVPLLFGGKKGSRIFGLIADTAVFDVPETMKLRSRLLFGAGLKHTANVCGGIITISEFSESRIKEHLNPLGKVVMAPCAADDMICENISNNQSSKEVKEKYGLPDRYILACSTLEPRKNTALIAEAYGSLVKEMSDKELPPLVLAGRNGWKMKEEIEKICGELGERVLVPGFIDDEDLGDIYAHADIFVDASVYEGFDMPPLEAMKCNVKKIILSDITVHREVFGDTVKYFKSGDAKELAECIKKCIEGDDRIKPDEISAVTEKYSWESSAKILLNEFTGKAL